MRERTTKTAAQKELDRQRALLRLEQLKRNLSEAGLPLHILQELVTEYAFAQDRRYRADYAFPIWGVIIEQEGGIWKYGRHNRAAGYLADMAKYNAAAVLGYVVLRYTPEQLLTPKAAAEIVQALKQQKGALS